MTNKNKVKVIKALVTGGAGFIGSHLCEELIRRGYRVTAVDNFSTSDPGNIAHLRQGPKFTFYQGDILDRKLMEKLIRQNDMVYHLAAAVGVQYILNHLVDSIIVNTEGTAIVLEFAAKHGKKVMITSSSEVYGKHDCGALDEEHEKVIGSSSVGRWSYAVGKALDEYLALAYFTERKLKVFGVRLFNTVGPRQSPQYGMVLPRFVQAALQKKPIPVYGDGDQVRSFTHVHDVVKAIIRLSEEAKAYGQIFNIGNPQPVTIRDLAKRVLELSKSKSRIKLIPFKTAFGSKADNFEETFCRVPNTAKIKKHIGFETKYRLDDIITDTIHYFRKKEIRQSHEN
jgi:UDP-glucose 4-epimerase